MIKTQSMVQPSSVDVITGKQCDCCKKDYPNNMEKFECQEFHHINFKGGYDSIFGDETIVECDLCQHCLFKMINKYMRTMDIYES